MDGVKQAPVEIGVNPAFTSYSSGMKSASQSKTDIDLREIQQKDIAEYTAYCTTCQTARKVLYDESERGKNILDIVKQ